MPRPPHKCARMMSENKLPTNHQAAVGINLHYELLLITRHEIYKYDISNKQFCKLADLNLGFHSYSNSLSFVKMKNDLYSFNSVDGYTVRKGAVDSKEWLDIAPTNKPRVHGAFVLCGDFIYAVGGTFKDAGDCCASGEKYSLVDKKWIAINNLTSMRAMHSLISFKNELYAFGGYDVDAHGLNTAECYHPGDDSWSEIPSMKFARESSAAVVCNGEIYVIGGCNPDIEDKNDVNHATDSENVDKDTGHESDTKNADKSNSSDDDDCNSIASSDSDSSSDWDVSAIIENDSDKNSDDCTSSEESTVSKIGKAVEKYDPITGQWCEVASLKYARSGHCACAVGNKIYVAGGDSRALEVLDVSSSSNTWNVEAKFDDLYGVQAIFQL